MIGPDVWRYNEPNPEFTEDAHLFKSWRVKAAQEGLRIKVGRWNVAGNPVAIWWILPLLFPRRIKF
ncbi:MAG: hypothetical protein V8R91_12050 [Butyricimonas faecihominis]